MELINNIGRILSRYWNLFLIGTGNTLLLSAITVACGILIGSLLALMRINNWKIGKVRPLNLIATVYVEIIRGTPLLLQLYFFSFLLPMMLPFVQMETSTAILLSLCLNSGAYVAEIIRAGISAVDKGQMEAARSLGLNYRQTMMKVIFPQAVKNILPALCNEFVSVIKETSLASTFFVGDLMTQFKTISGVTYLTLEPLIIAGIIYFALTFTMSKGIAVLERRLKTSD
jgi:His/Glu/Gln/Arg/opine family amino acid ABC transporter permease subunit